MEKFDILAHANGFRKAAQRCNMQLDNGDGTIEWLPIQGTVNAAFACELYLKAILHVEGYSYTELKGFGHNLNDLYLKKLSEKVRKEIADSIDISKLAIIANTFEAWRYLHEDMQEKWHDENVFVYQFMELLYKISNSYHNPQE